MIRHAIPELARALLARLSLVSGPPAPLPAASLVPLAAAAGEADAALEERRRAAFAGGGAAALRTALADADVEQRRSAQVHNRLSVGRHAPTGCSYYTN